MMRMTLMLMLVMMTMELWTSLGGDESKECLPHIVIIIMMVIIMTVMVMAMIMTLMTIEWRALLGTVQFNKYLPHTANLCN